MRVVVRRREEEARARVPACVCRTYRIVLAPLVVRGECASQPSPYPARFVQHQPAPLIGRAMGPIVCRHDHLLVAVRLRWLAVVDGHIDSLARAVRQCEVRQHRAFRDHAAIVRAPMEKSPAGLDALGAHQQGRQCTPEHAVTTRQPLGGRERSTLVLTSIPHQREKTTSSQPHTARWRGWRHESPPSMVSGWSMESSHQRRAPAVRYRYQPSGPRRPAAKAAAARGSRRWRSRPAAAEVQQPPPWAHP
jgi:hypothetical protein